MAFGREVVFDALGVHRSVLGTGAMADIRGELKHGEAVAEELFAEQGGITEVLLGLRGEVVED